MRHLLTLAALVALLFSAASFSGNDAHAARKKPVTAPADDASSDEAEPEKKEEAPSRPTRKRPVVAPGTEVHAPPPVDDEGAAPSPMTPAKVAPEQQAAPAADAPPPEFQGLPVRGSGSDEGESGPIRDPAEARTSTRQGNHQYIFSVRPGRPAPGTPVEFEWRIQEILHIPDPFLGDRKPAAPVRLIATISGPGGSSRHVVHPLDAPGTFGLHFTPAKAGAYDIQLARADGKRGHDLKSIAWVGMEPPADRPRRLGIHDKPEELIARRAPDDRTIASVMTELGKRWMALERAAGTAEAAQALGALQEQVAKVTGKAPSAEQPHVLEFDDLARQLSERVGELVGAGATEEAILDALQEVQTSSCLRCHARFRFGFAQSVRGWPQFELKDDLDTATPSSREAPVRRGRGPVAPTPGR